MNPLSCVAVCLTIRSEKAESGIEFPAALAFIGATAITVMGPVKPKHCAVNGWLVSVMPIIAPGGSIAGGVCHQLTDAGDSDMGEAVNWPLAVNCACPLCAATLVGVTVRDWSWRLLPPHPG